MNRKKNRDNSKNLSFRDYYHSLPDKSPRVEIRDEICKALDIIESTLYGKIKRNSFTKLEMERISEITGQRVESLFPDLV